LATDTAKILSRRDLDFQLFEWLDAGGLTARERFRDHSRSTFDAALDAAARVASERFYPINRLLDANEPRFDGERVHTPPELQGALDAFCEGGFMSAAQDAERGGMQLPYLVAQACFAWFQGASVGASAYPFLTVGNANLLLAHGSPEQIETWVPPMLEGRWFGTMCLSEPQAGSSLSDIRTRAEPQADGSYRVFGNKMWISGGEHELSENIVHLVLAKIPGDDGKLQPGVKGISLFIVPRRLLDANGKPAERNDVALAGLNHKMGFRGTTNCLLNFGEGRFVAPGSKPGALGWLVGKPGEGLKAMFHMMNEARIGIGLVAVMLGYTGYLHALDYARNRPQGRPPQGKNAAAPQVPIIEHADVRRMLLAQKAYVEGGLGLVLYCARLIDDSKTATDAAARADAVELLELLTPIAKSWPSQWCLEANSLAIQVHGGYGYTRDFNVEQYYRDNRLNPIHEGTHGIQALDLLGRKVRLNNGRAMDIFAARVAEAAAKARALHGEAGEEAGVWADQLEKMLGEIRATIAVLYAADDANVTLANAAVFLEAFGHVVMAWIWLEQAVCAEQGSAKAGATNAGANQADTDFYAGKRQAARFFFRYELPKVDAMLALLRTLDRTTLDMQDGWF
jgi:alkylation response protein AidB-like acyl-CoA dehydrogenase